MMDQMRSGMKNQSSLWQALDCQVLKMRVNGCTLSQSTSREKEASLRVAAHCGNILSSAEPTPFFQKAWVLDVL
jgi:hypothetical protein